MDQGPGSNSPREYGSPTIPSHVTPGTVGAPGGFPPRRGMPWWGWLLTGCGGCAVVSVLGLVALWGISNSLFQGSMKDKARANQQAVVASLGEIALYPGFTIDQAATRSIGLLHASQKGSGQGPGSMPKTLAVGTIPDSPDQLFQFYETKLPPLGWLRNTSSLPGSQNQQVYRKGMNDVFIVRGQSKSGGTTVIIIRGTPSDVRPYTNSLGL